MLLYFNHLHPSTPSQRPEKPGPACYNANRKSQGTNVLTNRKSQGTSVPTKEEGQKVNSATALTEYGGETPRGARLQTCRVAIRGDMSRPSQRSENGARGGTATAPRRRQASHPWTCRGGNAVRGHPRTHAERDSNPRYTRILRIGPVFVRGTDTPIGQPSQLKPLKKKALSSNTGRASPANH